MTDDEIKLEELEELLHEANNIPLTQTPDPLDVEIFKEEGYSECEGWINFGRGGLYVEFPGGDAEPVDGMMSALTMAIGFVKEYRARGFDVTIMMS